MSLRLQYKGQTTVPVEIEGLTPTSVRDKSVAEIEKTLLFHGNRQEPLAEFFNISGDPADLRMEFEGDLSGVHWIGAGMTEGSIHVTGNAGRHVGSEMTNGEIHVSGDAGDWVGGELHGGLIHVRGRAGHLVGAAYRGSRRGMTGGTILIGGDVGNELGHTMRRGLIAIGGGCGDCPVFNMIAGSVLVFGSCGIRPAAGMRRGTLGLFGPEPPPLLPTFRRATRFRPPFLRLMFAELARLGFAFDPALATAEYWLYCGDMIEEGRGEILMPAA
jgi:formylmethanofuran dehydrogenase subunit C